MKKIALLASAALLSFNISFSAFAGEWKQNSTGWWYQNDDGSNPAATWKQIEDKWYYFKSDGYMNTGWIKLSNQWYYCELTGEMRSSDLQTDVFTFRFSPDGSCPNFYENTIPSSQAGWSIFNTSSLATLTETLASGDVIYYKGNYWATPDYMSDLKNGNLAYIHDISREAAAGSTNRFSLLDLDIPDMDNDNSSDLDGFY